MAFSTLMLTKIAESIRPLSSQTGNLNSTKFLWTEHKSGVFQRYVSSIFRDLTRKGIVISYLDDLVIPAKDEKEGLEKLKIVFEVAKKYGLEIKFKKCQFLKKTIEFLGHDVENGTIKPSTVKAQAVRKFPKPTTIKQVQSFLGLTGYFRIYISRTIQR
ncbi:transposon Ty3-I Gag-Pol polyprotein [Trichonephila inaurata madagascariensis]|uniref:Transposon Ty3-I Gag-Pol polyprotein n=1 Tax=Trichonephila inaurata madagascariensis TaxID=2747483 RepID=A0A8X6XG39_9ARAC|nr:transposon Ty3-I Gag-Pol polyprotein [Trichonephila inaurata madagascariensis]